MTDRVAPQGTRPTGEVCPVFVFSLPRSGSTLTQRVLAAHPLVSSAAEPWILLPLVYATRQSGVYSEYGHRLSATALEDYAAGLPGGRPAFDRELRRLALQLYGMRSAPGARFFVDKTPRYHLILDEIFGLFPDAKFIFLWRNPLAVVASMMETWAGGRWNLHEYEVDLYRGVENLVSAYTSRRAQACSVRFEDLVTAPASGWARVFSHLGIEFDTALLDEFAGVPLAGRMGDPTGRLAYRGLSAEPIDKWKATLGNPLRKAWCRRYLRWIGAERLAVMGYDLAELLDALDAAPASGRFLLSDVPNMAWAAAARWIEPWILNQKWEALRHGERPPIHL